MSPVQSYFGRLFLVAVMIAIAGPSRVGCAQDDPEGDESAEAVRPEQQQQAAELQRVEIKQTYIDDLSRFMASPSGTKVNLAAQLEAQLTTALGNLKSECHPTDSQMRKLELAGRGDIKRFMDRLGQAAREFVEAPGDFDALQMIELDVRKAKNALSAGLFGEDSLFFKTLVKNNLRYSVSVARAVAALQGNIGLKDSQRTELVDLIIRETQQPRKFGKASELAIVLFQMSRISTDKLRRICSEAQWGEMCRWIATYKQGAGSESALRRSGFVFDEETTPILDEPAPPVAKNDGPGGTKRINHD